MAIAILTTIPLYIVLLISKFVNFIKTKKSNERIPTPNNADDPQEERPMLNTTL